MRWLMLKPPREAAPKFSTHRNYEIITVRCFVLPSFVIISYMAKDIIFYYYWRPIPITNLFLVWSMNEFFLSPKSSSASVLHICDHLYAYNDFILLQIQTTIILSSSCGISSVISFYYQIQLSCPLWTNILFQ